MKADEIKLTEFLQGKQQFTIPIYQRTYSWTPKQCSKLWKDIINITKDDDIDYHFIGSIVRVEDKHDTSEIPKQTIIDGQQRITTILLLISALIRTHINKDRKEELQESYLINKHGKEERKYKLILTQQDKNSLIDIIEDRPIKNLTSERIKSNFNFFQEKMENEDPEKIYTAIRKLMVVDISLDLNYDDPQRIFESLNSTGLELSQADLIRNYVLMGLPDEHQEQLYNNHWLPMEVNFGQSDYKKYFDRFMRDYLTIKNNQIPKIGNVYETFKKLCANTKETKRVNEIISEVHKYSEYFVRMVLGKEDNKKINKSFLDLKELRVDVAYPFLLSVYDDYENDLLSEDNFLIILKLTQSYVYRRFVCGIPTNSLNNTFAKLHKSIDKDNYLESLRAIFALLESYRRFPNDDEFKQELKMKDLYNVKNNKFWLDKVENYNRKEFVNVEEYTIEHIMPQNEKLSEEWKEMLGEKWEEIHQKYIHTIGNLTLTGYNSELSNKPFEEKKNMKGGFNDSRLRVNESLQEVNIWDKGAIQKRAETLSNIVADIWPYPLISAEILEKYKESTKKDGKEIYSIEDYQFITDGPMKEVYAMFRKRVMNIDASIKEEFLKSYIAYKSFTNFVDVQPQKSQLRLILNISYDDIDDPKGLCSDVSNKGTLGNGDTSVYLSSLEELEYIVDLVKQSFDANE